MNILMEVIIESRDVLTCVFCLHSKDIACCQKSTFVALHPSNLQRCSHGGRTKIMC